LVSRVYYSRPSSPAADVNPTESSTFCVIKLPSHKFSCVPVPRVAKFFLVIGLPIHRFIVYNGKAVPLSLCALENMRLGLSLMANNA